MLQATGVGIAVWRVASLDPVEDEPFDLSSNLQPIDVELANLKRLQPTRQRHGVMHRDSLRAARAISEGVRDVDPREAPAGVPGLTGRRLSGL